MRIARTLLLVVALLVVGGVSYAGDYHQNDQAHTVTYMVTDSSGDHVTGETIRLTVRSWDNATYLDFNDNEWKLFSSTTTPHQTMNEDADGGFYWYPVTIDSARLASGDYVFIVSNDSATYGDLQAECIHIDNVGELIRIHR